MQDRLKFRAVLKNDRFVIIVPVDAVFETGYQIDTNIAQKIFENKYPNKCFFSDFLEIIEKQEYISQYSFDCDLLITKDFTNLMQCTGLKDKNGKLIFEGDIVADISSGCVATIEYLSSSYSLMAHIRRMDDFTPIEEICYTGAEGTPFEVIGNIYENPELLEEK